jgi:hypothetical protein
MGSADHETEAAVSAKNFHLSMSIRGRLMNWRDRDNVGLFKDDSGLSMTPAAAKAELLDLLSKGHELIPMGPCDAFDKVTGCPGHLVADPEHERTT